MRRFPVYICIDTSNAMRGEPIEAVRDGLAGLFNSLRQNPFALEIVWISIITFDLQVREILPLTELYEIKLPEINCPGNGASFLGAALKYIAQLIKRDVIIPIAESKGDYTPIVIIFSNGKVSDPLAYRAAIPTIKSLRLERIFAITTGAKANIANLEYLNPSIYSLDSIDIYSTCIAPIFYSIYSSSGPISVNSLIFDEPQEHPVSPAPQPPVSPPSQGNPMTRRLLTYICIDTSGSMRGEPIEAVNAGLQALLASLRQNPYALESVHLTITTFDSQIKDVLPLTPLEQVVLPEIVCPESGATFLGGALEHVAHAVQRDRIVKSGEQKGDWRPILIILTDGKPTDLLAYSEAIPVIKSLGFGNIVACAAGPKADASYLKQLTDTVASLDTMDASAFAQFFQWVSAAVASSSVSVGSPSATNDLPPPPPEINIVL